MSSKKTEKLQQPVSKSKSRSAFNERLQRKHGIRDLAKRFLIVCEDAKSAPNYFKALRNHFKLTTTSIRVVGSDGDSQPIQVVARAIKFKDEANESKSDNVPFDEVWCVIDGDYGVEIANARASARANQVQLAISTKCFEYWILLHFEEKDNSTLDCDALVSLLKKKHIPKYDKGTCNFHDVVPLVHDACRRAKKLRRPAEYPDPENQNPCSEVYLLINAIRNTGPRVSS